MNTNLLKLRKLKYQHLDHLLGQSVLVSSLSEVEQTVLRQLVPNWSQFLKLKTSQKDIAIDIGKHGVLQLTFVTSKNELMVDLPTAPLRLLRELGFFNPDEREDGAELGCKDSTGAGDVADTVNDLDVFIYVTLASSPPMETIKELMAEVAAELSTGVTSEAALDTVLQRRIRYAASLFPLTFKVEDAFLSNSDSIYLRKSFYM